MISYHVTDEVLTVFVANKVYTRTSSDLNFEDTKNYLLTTAQEDMDEQGLVDLLNPVQAVVAGNTSGVTIENDMVLLNGVPVDNSVCWKLLEVSKSGGNVGVWVNFLTKLMENPSFKSRRDLYNFLDHFVTPICPDGDFLAFKRVRGNFFDIHSNTMDNSPGKIVEMPRDGVDDDSNRTCSSGLHACASDYLGDFYASTAGYKVVVVKINPKDVVSIPVDYGFSKMRVCRYEVLSEVSESDVERISKESFTTFGTKEPSLDELDEETPEAEYDTELFVGATVVTKNGVVLDVIDYDEENDLYPWSLKDWDGSVLSYTEEGKYYSDGPESGLDLVLE